MGLVRHRHVNIILVSWDVPGWEQLDWEELFGFGVWVFSFSVKVEGNFESAHVIILILALNSNVETAELTGAIFPVSCIVAVGSTLGGAPLLVHVDSHRQLLKSHILLLVVALRHVGSRLLADVGKLDHHLGQTFTAEALESNTDCLLWIGDEMAVESALTLVSDSNAGLIGIEVRLTISSRLAKGTEEVAVGVVDEEVSDVVRWTHSDIVGAKVAIGIAVTGVGRLESKHLI